MCVSKLCIVHAISVKRTLFVQFFDVMCISVDDFRAIHLSLLESHFKTSVESKKAERIEFLPIHWHRALHGDATGVDRCVSACYVEVFCGKDKKFLSI